MKTRNYIHLFDTTKDWNRLDACLFVKLHWNNDIAGLVTDFARCNGTSPDNIRMFVYPTLEMWENALKDWQTKCNANPRNYAHVDFS